MSDPRVGIVGDETLSAAVERAGATPLVTSADDIESTVATVAVGRTALLEIAEYGSDPSTPVVPVDVDRGVQSVPRESVESALENVLSGAFSTRRHPVLVAATPRGEVRALFDVFFVAAEPARISEFAVDCGDDAVARFRSDGVVVSTPAGSVGYNRAADGPVLAPGTDVLAVVPVAPFTIDCDDWVVPGDDVTVTVARDEPAVELLADGHHAAELGADEPVSLSTAETVVTAVVDESDPFFRA